MRGWTSSPRIGKSAKIIPTQLEFVDIAGLVRGASKGEGLGNQFLANIREVDAIVHVLRCFDGEVTHVEDSVDPIRDAETVETELMLADMESLEKRYDAAVKKRQGRRQGSQGAARRDGAGAGGAARRQAGAHRHRLAVGRAEAAVQAAAAADRQARALCLQCRRRRGRRPATPSRKKVEARAKAEGAVSVVISAAIEAEVAQLTDEAEKAEFLAALGLSETGLDRVIRAGYALLDLITFFTVGPKEARAWTVRRGAKAPEAAGVIHTDFERGFIRSETIAYDDFIACGGEAGAKDAGKMRSEGKDYVVQDGDVLHFRFNV